MSAECKGNWDHDVMKKGGVYDAMQCYGNGEPLPNDLNTRIAEAGFTPVGFC